MTAGLDVAVVERVAPLAQALLTGRARALAYLHHADLRLEVAESRFASAENGAPRASGEDATLSLGVRVLAGDRSVAAGYVGHVLGAADLPRLERILEEALQSAYRRALANAEMKAQAREKFGVLGEALDDIRLAAVAICQDVIPAVFEVDPRSLPLDEMLRFTVDAGRRVAAAHGDVRYSHVATLTQLNRELFASSDGALIDQSSALTQGFCHVVAEADGGSQELYDVVGHQRGWEILTRGIDDPLLASPPFADFAVALAGEAVDLAHAPALPASDREVTVVTDPHYNTLLAHEIVGHPTELDRGLKMETAYAGRSWLLRDLSHHEVGRRVASPLVTAYSDPSLPGYGHYVYDHEGTPARRVTHIDRGVFTGFMNSRQTAAVFGGPPNGHWKATDVSLVPLVRMSTTVFAAGERDPADIVGEVEEGYYLSGHRVPSIAESRENFRISARRVYEIRNGRLGRLYRDGGIMAGSRAFLLAVDAVGSDFRLYPIPNCGKGQPMQTRRLGNGGPTLRSRAVLTGLR
jgi:TldD protein